MVVEFSRVSLHSQKEKKTTKIWSEYEARHATYSQKLKPRNFTEEKYLLHNISKYDKNPDSQNLCS